MLTDWPAPSGEAELLAQVHRRARAITTRRIAARTLPVAAAALALSASLLLGHDGRPASLRVAGEGVPSDAQDESAPSHNPSTGPEDPQEPGMSIGTQPLGDETIEVRPQELPLPKSEQPRPVPGPHVVDDPEGDDTPDQDSIDIRYGDLAYQAGNDSLRFTIGVTNLATAPAGVNHSMSFYYDNWSYSVAATRHEGRPVIVMVAGYECGSCSVTYDVPRHEVRIQVPMSFLNERVTQDSGRSVWPPSRPPSAPIGKGSTLERFRAYAHVLRGGPVDGTDETQPHDTAESDQRWTFR